MEKLVYAEIGRVTDVMRRDSRVLLIGDTGLFLVTTESHSKHYFEEFHEVVPEAIDDYQIVLVNGEISSKLFPRNN